jgi:hypothetical protein
MQLLVKVHLIGACRKYLPVSLKAEGNVDPHPILSKAAAAALTNTAAITNIRMIDRIVFLPMR